MKHPVISGYCLWCWHHDSESLCEFTRFTRWMQNSARQLPTFEPSRHRHLARLSPKALYATVDTDFTIPQRVEGWVDRWLVTQTV